MKNRFFGGLLILLTVFAALFLMTAYGKSGDSIVGTWNSANGDEVLIFETDGSCSVPFTYDGGWWESCDRYSIDSDGTLVLSSSKGNIDSERFARQNSAQEVEENGGYYLSGDSLVLLDFRTLRSYTRK